VSARRKRLQPKESDPARKLASNRRIHQVRHAETHPRIAPEGHGA
jgi:hypothetical protein